VTRARVLFLVLAIASPTIDARIVHSQTSLYQNIIVMDDGSLRCMQFTVRKDQRNQSCVDLKAPKHLVFPYTRMMLAALLLDPSPTNVLIVGLGGGTLPTTLAQLYPNARIDVVELDPAVVAVAKAYFDFAPTPNMNVFEQDARVWVKRAASAPRRYDLVMLDAFNGDYIPEHLMTREYLQEVRELLVDGGAVASNTFAISQLYHNESVTYESVFGTFYNLKSDDTANRVIIARRGSLLDGPALERAAQPLIAPLRPFGVPIERYPAQMKTRPDWKRDARVLTDQYSPANLLKGRP
jgi:spermidine synthase